MASKPSVHFVVYIDLPQNTKDIYKHNYTKDTLIDSLSLWSSLGRVALILLVRMLFALVFNLVNPATLIVLCEHLDLLCIVELDVPTHLIMNVSSHHTGDVIAYKLQIKLKNTDLFTVLLKFIYGFLVFDQNYIEEKVSEEIE